MRSIFARPAVRTRRADAIPLWLMLPAPLAFKVRALRPGAAAPEIGPVHREVEHDPDK